MIKKITFKNFRNLNSSFSFSEKFQIIVGKNNSGKTNVLDGIKIAFSSLTNDFIRIKQSDFKDSDDSTPFEILVELNENAIPSLSYDVSGQKECGFKVSVTKTSSGRYVRKVSLLNGSPVDMEIVREDPNIPNLCTIPLIRSEDLYTDGLITGISNFIESESEYKNLIEDSKKTIVDSMKEKIQRFKDFCKKFGQELDVDFTPPKIIDEKAYIVDGDKPHNYQIGSGYKSIATVILNTLNDKFNIILIDEIENHLHPSLIRSLVRELRTLDNCLVISTSHSPVVVNEAKMSELIDVSGNSFSLLSSGNSEKLDTFLHPGRAELVFADNVILVEGYSEELLLKTYLSAKNINWTVVNVAGIMFEPYISLAKLLSKRIIVISDDDISLSATLQKSTRFCNLQCLCSSQKVKLIEVSNTLESDLYAGGFLGDCKDLIEPHHVHNTIYISKQGKKTEIARTLVVNKKDLSNWHVIKEIDNEFKSY